MDTEPTMMKPFQPKWRIARLVFFIFAHILAAFGLGFLFKAKVSTLIFAYLLHRYGGIGISAGNHRLWSHRAFKARLPLRIFLMIGSTISFQRPVIEWAHDHRVHHKYVDTDADPYNAKRGFWFSHILWIIQEPHPDYFKKLQAVSVDDLLNDSLLRFQKRYYSVLALIFCYVLPVAIPCYFFGEAFLYSVTINELNLMISSHMTFAINSFAHWLGDRPYNAKITPVDIPALNVVTLSGDGFHNFHHTFPVDYASSEFGFWLNTTKMFIDLMAKIGLAYDLKTVDKKIVLRTKNKNNQ